MLRNNGIRVNLYDGAEARAEKAKHVIGEHFLTLLLAIDDVIRKGITAK
jgi:hypothetical protein